jgi:hypothetical protein
MDEDAERPAAAHNLGTPRGGDALQSDGKIAVLVLQ